MLRANLGLYAPQPSQSDSSHSLIIKGKCICINSINSEDLNGFTAHQCCCVCATAQTISAMLQLVWLAVCLALRVP